jgi:ribosomal protein S18 acetylase RimI-like enzyme
LNADLIVRQMAQSDLRQVKQVIDMSFPRFYRYFSFHSVQEEGQVLVAEFQGMIVGFAKLIYFKIGIKKYGCILWIAVHPSSRRKGIALKLTNIATQRLKEEGAKAIFASTQRRNFGALTVLRLENFRRMRFVGLWHLFGWRVFQFYSAIWFAPYEVVLMHD